MKTLPSQAPAKPSHMLLTENAGVYYLHLMLEKFGEVRQFVSIEMDNDAGVEEGGPDDSTSVKNENTKTESEQGKRRVKRKRRSEPVPSSIVALTLVEEKLANERVAMYQEQKRYVAEQRELVATKKEKIAKDSKYLDDQRRYDVLKARQAALEEAKAAAEPNERWIEFLEKIVSELMEMIMTSK